MSEGFRDPNIQNLYNVREQIFAMISRVLRMAAVATVKLGLKDSYSISIDEDGIPVNDYGYIGDNYVGEQRSIVAVAEKG